MNMRNAFRYGYLVIAMTFLTTTSAFACPEGEYQACFITCICVPNSGKLTGPIREPSAQLAALALERWISESRSSAAKGGTQPIPDAVKNYLKKFYSDDILNAVRYKVGDSGILNTARTAFNNAEVDAVTLIDVVIFRSANDAQGNIPLWAHELKHVQQYREWGVRDFSIRYARDFNSVENPAYGIQKRVADSLKSAGESAGCSDTTAVVKALYRNILERDGEEQGVRHHVVMLNNGTINVRQLVSAFASSPEHIQRFAQNRPGPDQIKTLYRHVLGREGEPAGVAHNTERLASVQYVGMVNAFVNSREYSESFGDWNVPDSPTKVTKYCR